MTGSRDPRQALLFQYKLPRKYQQSARALLKRATVLIFLGAKVHRLTNQANTKAPGQPLT